jgi:glycosyltransferase involved in cell wall biosynthesis
MPEPDAAVRIMGVSLPDTSDWREPLPAGKWSQFFGALGHRCNVVDVVNPRTSGLEQYLNLAWAARPHRRRWLARAGFNPRHLAAVNAALERELRGRSGSYDLIVQLQTLCEPRSDSVRAPYVIYTDNTMALTQRVYPPFAPLSPRMMRDWIEFETSVCRGAQVVFTFSEFARGSVIDDYGCAPDRVLAVGAGANQLEQSVDGKDYSRPRALFVGRPFEPKGGKILLEAWQTVAAEVPGAQLAIAGPKRDPAPRFGRGVEFLGRLNRAQLSEQYRAASVFVLPSLFDAWGHVFVEAMGHGLPCIACDCCAMPEIVSHGESGLLVPRAQPEPLAQALVALLTDAERARAMGQAGHRRVLEQLTWRHVADRVVDQLRLTAAGGS